MQAEAEKRFAIQSEGGPVGSKIFFDHVKRKYVMSGAVRGVWVVKTVVSAISFAACLKSSPELMRSLIAFQNGKGGMAFVQVQHGVSNSQVFKHFGAPDAENDLLPETLLHVPYIKSA